MEAYEREQQDSTRGSARQMTEDERDELLYELKMKWAKLNKAYAGLSFSPTCLRTGGERNRWRRR